MGPGGVEFAIADGAQPFEFGLGVGVQLFDLRLGLRALLREFRLSLRLQLFDLRVARSQFGLGLCLGLGPHAAGGSMGRLDHVGEVLAERGEVGLARAVDPSAVAAGSPADVAFSSVTSECSW